MTLSRFLSSHFQLRAIVQRDFGHFQEKENDALFKARKGLQPSLIILLGEKTKKKKSSLWLLTFGSLFILNKFGILDAPFRPWQGYVVGYTIGI